jgi:WD40 repeat protein
VFVSSTFADFIEERNALQNDVFPRIRDYCRQKGARFQAIDLRWGVPREVADNQQTLALCLQELRACQDQSPGVNLIVLVGERYGWRPLPARIEASEFDALLAVMQVRQKRRLRKQYRRDNNAVPAQYVLIPRTRVLNRDRRRRFEEGLRKDLTNAATIAFGKEDPRSAKYHRSATHFEIRQGVFESPEGVNALCYVRTIRGLPDDETAAAYRDLRMNGPGKTVVDKDAKQDIETLRTEMASLSAHCVRTYAGEWNGGRPVLDLTAFSAVVESDLRDRIDAETRAFHSEPSIVRERRIQLKFATARGSRISGRDAVLDRINQYLKSDSRQPLIVTGRSGAGKTAVLAKTWLDQRATNSEVICLVRIIGATPGSSELRPLMRSLCNELQTTALAQADLPDDLTELVAEFEKRLRVAASINDVILILDGLDQLAPTDDAYSLHWLPQGDLPPRVKILLSMRREDDVDHACLRSAQRRFPNAFEQLSELVPEDGRQMLASWLEDAEMSGLRRRLQPEQKAVLLQGFAACPIPLYLKLAFEQACLWHSYDAVKSIAPDVTTLLHEFFQRLERPEYHGVVLPGRALGYLKTARRGLSEDELVDILSADSEVMDDFRRRSPDSPHVNTLPVVMWLRLASELGPYLMSLSFDGAVVLSFQHLQIADVVEKRYLNGPAQQLRLAAVTRHFDHGFAHPVVDAVSVKDRVEAVNKRQVDELAWLLTRSIERGDLRAIPKLEQLLTDLRFIEAKCLAGGMYDLIADYERAFDALRLTEGGLAKHLDLTNAFNFVSSVSHLLAKYPHETIPIARCATNRTLAKKAETLCQTRKAVWIARTPVGRSDPGGLMRTLPRSTEGVAMDGSGRVAITRGKGSSAAVWNLATGELVRYLSGHRDGISALAMTLDGQRAVTGGGTFLHVTRAGIVDGAIIATPVIDISGKPSEITPDYALRVWDVTTGAARGVLIGHTDRVYAVAISQDGATVVSAAADETVRLWNAVRLTSVEVNRVCLREVRSLALDAGGDLCVIVCGDGKIHFWRPRSYEWEMLHPPKNAKYLGAVLSGDGGLVIAATENGLHTWPVKNHLDIESVTIEVPLGGPVCTSPDGRVILAAAKDKGFIVWKRGGLSSSVEIHGDKARVSSLAVSTDGRFALCGSGDGTRLLDLSRLPIGSENFGSRPWAELTATARNGAQLIWLHRGIDVERLVARPLDTVTPEIEKWTLTGEGGGEFCAGGEAFALWNAGTVSVWNTQSAECLGSLDNEESAMQVYAASSDASVIVAADENYEISAWSALDQKLIHRLGRHREDVEVIELSADGRIAVSGGGKHHQAHEIPGDYALRVWDLQRGKRLHSLVGHSTPIAGVVLDPRGTAAVSISREDIAAKLLFWDIDCGLRLRAEMVAPMNLYPSRMLRAKNICFAPDGATLAIGAFNNNMTGIRLFNPLIGETEVLAESDGRFWRLDFVRSGRIVVGYAWVGTRFSVWDFVTGDLLADYPFPTEFWPYHFEWVDAPPGRCATAVAEDLCTFEIKNLPSMELTGSSIISDLSLNHERKRLAALWYVIDNPIPPDINGKNMFRYVGSILDQVCLPVSGVSNEAVRHAAIKAAIAAGRIVLPEALARLKTESNWRVVGALALVVSSVHCESLEDDRCACLARVAQHSDVRTRKQIALILSKYQNAWSEDLLRDLRRDDAVDAFLRRVKAGKGNMAELLQDLLSADTLLQNRLYPAADNAAAEHARVLRDMVTHSKAPTTWPGGTHPYFEHLRFRSLRNQSRTSDPVRAAAYQNQVRYLRIAHNLNSVPSAEAELLTSIERLASLSLPVKRLLAAKLARANDENRSAEFLSVRDSVDLLKAVWETISDETIRRAWTDLADFEDVTDLINALGAGEALVKISPGIGTREWYTYLEFVTDNTAHAIYCLANACAQTLPQADNRSIIISIFESAGLSKQAQALEQILGNQ